MNTRRFGIAIMWFLLFSTIDVRAEDDCGCLSMFNRVVYTNEKLSTNTAIQKSYKRLQCSSEYSTHAQAQAAGFELGTKVYGVPLKLGGNLTITKLASGKRITANQMTINIALMIS